ncbi:MAG: DUF1749 domain-containing protein [Candidatus Liptonbacteria bacterium]|nr:DUF1749 domain-containing protein [Candidatus Liptonbacteria bacterium]
MRMVKPELVGIKTPDGLELPGLLYSTKAHQSAAIYLHGNGSSSVFYGEPQYSRVLAAELNRRGIAFLAFNNRGAHLIKKLTIRKGNIEKRRRFGMAYEKIRECVPDINGAVQFLKSRGYRKLYLVGASTGANKICVYDHYQKRNPISGYILLAGGDDVGITYRSSGRTKFWRLLKEARRKIKAGQGGEIIKELLPDTIFSYQGFFDLANPDGDYNTFPFYEVLRRVSLSTRPLFRFYRKMRKPTLVVYGEQDEYAWGNVPKVIEILKSYQPDFAYRIIPGADHGFKGHRGELGRIMAKWLARPEARVIKKRS